MAGKKKDTKSKAAAKEEKKKKQEQKALKKADKKEKKGKGNKGAQDSDDEDLDAILAEMREKDKERTAVTIENDCPQPSPRANFSMCILDGAFNNELFLFGGEFYDGTNSECFNDVYRLNLDKIEWKKKYRKYKPLKRSGKCYICEQPKVKRAYHTICDDCGKQQNCCVWCKLDFNNEQNKAKVTKEARAEMAVQEQEAFEAAIAGLSERDKRTMRRRRQREEEGFYEDGEDENSDEYAGHKRPREDFGNDANNDDGCNDTAFSAVGAAAETGHLTGDVKMTAPGVTKMERLEMLKESRARVQAPKNQKEHTEEAQPGSFLDLAASSAVVGEE